MPAADFMILWCIFVVRVLLKIHEVYFQTDIGRHRDESSQVRSRLRFGSTRGDLPFYLPSILTAMRVQKNDQPIDADTIIQNIPKASRHLFTSKIGGCYGIA